MTKPIQPASFLRVTISVAHERVRWNSLGVFHRYLAFVVFLFVAGGCNSVPRDPYIDCNSRFSKVIVTDFVGDPVAEWTAAGRVSYDGSHQTYNFLAVEKISYGRTVQTRRYVIGRPVNVNGANVSVFEVEPPTWICPDGPGIVAKWY